MTVDTDTFKTRDLEPLIGTEIRSDAETLLSGRHARDIRALFEERGVLVFPGIGLDDEEQIAFTRTLGTQRSRTTATPTSEASRSSSTR